MCMHTAHVHSYTLTHVHIYTHFTFVLYHTHTQVFEASPVFRTQGSGVLIQTNGARALQAIHPGLMHRCVSLGLCVCTVRVCRGPKRLHRKRVWQGYAACCLCGQVGFMPGHRLLAASKHSWLCCVVLCRWPHVGRRP